MRRDILLARLNWMDTVLGDSVRDALRTAWILDTNTTVKLLYGHQVGAELRSVLLWYGRQRFWQRRVIEVIGQRYLYNLRETAGILSLICHGMPDLI